MFIVISRRSVQISLSNARLVQISLNNGRSVQMSLSNGRVFTKMVRVKH